MAPHGPIDEKRPDTAESLGNGLYNSLQIPNGDFLERFYDSALRLPRRATSQQLASSEAERIAYQLALVLVASSIPRRLGGDADREELALDKKRCRRVAHALDQSLHSWDRRPKFTFDEEVVRIHGAQLDWLEFAADHALRIDASRRLVATWSIRNSELRWGRTALVRLNNELSWMSYALRD